MLYLFLLYKIYTRSQLESFSSTQFFFKYYLPNFFLSFFSLLLTLSIPSDFEDFFVVVFFLDEVVVDPDVAGRAEDDLEEPTEGKSKSFLI